MSALIGFWPVNCQQHLEAQFQELSTHIQQITQKLTQDTEWKMAIDQKLQNIVDFFDHSIPIPGHPDQPQTFSQLNLFPSKLAPSFDLPPSSELWSPPFDLSPSFDLSLSNLPWPTISILQGRDPDCDTLISDRSAF